MQRGSRARLHGSVIYSLARQLSRPEGSLCEPTALLSAAQVQRSAEFAALRMGDAARLRKDVADLDEQIEETVLAAGYSL